jgi:hypothetical protein
MQSSGVPGGTQLGGGAGSNNLFPSLGTFLGDAINSSDSNSHLCGDPLPADYMELNGGQRSACDATEASQLNVVSCEYASL